MTPRIITAEEARALRHQSEEGLAIMLAAGAPDALTRAPRVVASLCHTVEALHAEIETLRALVGGGPNRWMVYHPEQSMEWFDSRSDAEAFALDFMTEFLHDNGEAHDDQCVIFAVVAHTEEVIGATRDDGSERGEWLRERGLDYEVEGYVVVAAGEVTP
jgi:hypothetical protein